MDVTGKEALLVYQDDSSDEMEDVMNDLLVPASDTDDDFDEEEGDETMEVSLFHHLTLIFLNTSLLRRPSWTQIQKWK